MVYEYTVHALCCSRHESASGFYRVSTYFLAKVFCDIIPMRAVPLCVYSVIIYFMAGKNDAVDFVGVQSLHMLIRHWRHYDMHRSYGRSHSIHQRMPFCRLNRWNHKNLSSGQPLIVTVTLWHLQLLLHCALASCGAVYCYRSCLWVCDRGRAGGVCYHDNSKLPASIFTKLGV